MQRTESYTGIDGINQQDRALQETMGRIVDRSKEHLGPGDKAIGQTRRMLRAAVMTVQEGGDPAGTGTSYYHIRAGEEVLPATPTGTQSWRPTSRRRRSSRRCEAAEPACAAKTLTPELDP